VVDGVLCEEFMALVPEKKREIAEGLDRTASEIARQIEAIRARVA
jgi:hypothetical protein